MSRILVVFCHVIMKISSIFTKGLVILYDSKPILLDLMDLIGSITLLCTLKHLCGHH